MTGKVRTPVLLDMANVWQQFWSRNQYTDRLCGDYSLLYPSATAKLVGTTWPTDPGSMVGQGCLCLLYRAPVGGRVARLEAGPPEDHPPDFSVSGHPGQKDREP
jgi:hypothetical protein